MAARNIELMVWRQGKGESQGAWESHVVDGAQSVSLLQALKSLNKGGAGIAFNGSGDGDAMCGLLVDGTPCLASNVQVSDLGDKSYLEPFRSFPVVQDLEVNMEALARDLRAVDALAPEIMKEMGSISNCLRCGVCQEACPDYTGDGTYMGPAPVVLLDWGNNAPGGEEKKRERLTMLTSDRGVHHDRSGFAFEIGCPNELSLRRSMARAKRDASWHWLKSVLEQ